jgi:phosphatidylinositol 4-kinase
LTAHIGYHTARKDSLYKMHRILMAFLNENMQIHIAKGLRASTISNIMNLNFNIERKLMEEVPLDNVCL